MKRVRLIRKTSLRRSAFMPKRWPRATEATKDEIKLQMAFRDAALSQGCCQSCGYTGVFVEAHHAISKQLLRRLLSKKGAPAAPEVIWDPRNALLLCVEPAPNRCHNRHTLAMRRLDRGTLRPENWEFACEHGLDWVLKTEYLGARAA